MSRTRRLSGLLLLVAAAAVLPVAGRIAGGKTLVWRDAAKMGVPYRGLIVSALRDWRLPQWDPYEGTGLPLLARPDFAVLHPVSVVSAWIAPGSGLDAQIVACVALAAAGAALLALALGASGPAAAAAGVGYGLSGYVLGMSCSVPYLFAATTAPWALAALRWAASAGPLGIAAAALAVGAQLLAGDLQWATFVAALGLVLAFGAGGWRGMLRAGAALSIGAMAAAIELAPAWSFFESSQRYLGLAPAERRYWALAPWRLFELVAPGFFSGEPLGPAALVFRRLGGPNVLSLPFVPSIFVGAPLLILATIGVTRSRASRILAGSAAAALWIALGYHLGADQLLRHVPIVGAFRYSEKLVGPFTLCVAVLAAAGVDRVASGELPRWASRATWVALAASAGLAVFLLAAPETARELFSRAGASNAAELARSQLRNGLVHAVITLAVLAALLAWARHPRGAAAAAALALLVYAESWAAAGFALHVGAAAEDESPALAAIAGSTAVPRVSTPLPQNASALRVAAVADGSDRGDALDQLMSMERAMGVSPYGARAGVDNIQPYAPTLPRRARAVFDAVQDERWLRRFAVTHVVARRALTPADQELAEAAVSGGTPVLQDPLGRFGVWAVPHRPWASFAERCVEAATPEDAVRALSTVMALERPDVIVEQLRDVPTSPGRIVAVQREPERLQIIAEAVGAGLLVVDDAFAPGWTASIDGRDTAIVPADVLVRAVVFPAGRHVVEMRYEAPGLRAGLRISAAGLLAIAALASAHALARFRSRRSARAHGEPPPAPPAA